MDIVRLRTLTCLAVRAAVEASGEILDVYREAFPVETKPDNTPLTQADLRSTRVIEQTLSQTEIPVLGEEGAHAPYEIRKHWKWLWLIDPLDGTKEFISRNGEFTVNIALIRDGIPVAGVVLAPAQGDVYFALEGQKAWRIRIANAKTHTDNWESLIAVSTVLPCTTRTPGDRVTVVSSRSHLHPETREYIEKLRSLVGEVDIVSRGSALKLCMIAEGCADVYPRRGTTMEWDIAAGHALVREAGGCVRLFERQQDLTYNKPDLRNPSFISYGPQMRRLDNPGEKQ